jgi:predicted DnaQ family exonuclease/DinG family helicase
MPEYAALDLETTGLDPERDRVIEVGAVAFDSNGLTLETLEQLVDPGRAVPDAVQRLTGIEPQSLVGAAAPEVAIEALTKVLAGRQAVGHGASLDLDFLRAAGRWDAGRELIDTLHVARILLPNVPSHSLSNLAIELGLEQPRPHRALDDAEATRQLFLRLRDEAAGLEEGLKESMLALVAPYPWAIASFFAESLVMPPPDLPPAGDAGTGAELGEPRRSRAAATDDPDLLARLLAPDGALAAAFPDYEHRESQLQMLLAVAQTFKRGGMLAVEAGTGTGKSLAYLIPALARAVKRAERVVVSTHTHTLQEQLMSRDLPGLRHWLPWDFTTCLLKGRSNYISLRRWRRYLAEPCHADEELRFKLKILVWLHQTESGDRSELRLQGREEVYWARIASDPLDCVGVHCRAEDCYVHRARAEAERSDLIVVNHALLLADAARGGGLLPAYDHLVVDEAHHLEDAATQGLRQEVDGPGLLALLERLASGAEGEQGLIADAVAQPRLGESQDPLSAARPIAVSARARAAAMFEIAGQWVRARLAENGRDESLRLTPATKEADGWPDVALEAENAVTALAALDAQLRRSVAMSRDALGGEEPDQVLRELEIIRGRLAEAAQLLREALLEPEANRIYWFTVLARSSNLVLRSAPLNVGSLLREHVYRDRSTVIFTSASLAVAGRFDYFQHRVGLERDIETLLLPSPFDYLDQALICLPSDLPEPQDIDFDEVVTEIVAEISGRIGGRTLALFTSHRQLRDVYDSLKHRGDLDEVLILGQGIDGQRRHVLKSFVESERPLLLGTASFWEGIDIPGDRLSCVIIVRLPFPVPSDPVYAARAEQLRDSFSMYALPRAALRLKQGFGRLIRRGSDRGAVVILDGRISTRDYGRALLEALPPASRYVGPAADVGSRVEAWLAPLFGPEPPAEAPGHRISRRGSE